MKTEQNRHIEPTNGRSLHTIDHVAELQKRVVALVAERFASAWDEYRRALGSPAPGPLEPPDIAAFLQQAPPVLQRALLAELLRIEWEWRTELGQLVDVEALVTRMPQFQAVIRAVCAEQWESSTRLGVIPERAEATTRSFGGTDVSRRGLSSSVMPGERVAKEYVAECCLQSFPWKDTYTIRDPVADGRLVLKRFAIWVDQERTAGLLEVLKRAAVRARLGIRDAGSDPGTLWVVRDFVEGRSLADHLRAHEWSFKGIALLVAALADVADDLHNDGVVHGNIKPSNVFLLPDGTPRLVDPWICGVPAAETATVPPSEYAYLAPEQLRDLERPRLAVPGDVYGVGVILYELLVGRVPYLGHSFSEFLRQVRDREPRPLRMVDPRIDPELERICLRAVEKKATRRFPTARALADALREWAERSDVSSAGKPRSRRDSTTGPPAAPGRSEAGSSVRAPSASTRAPTGTSWKTLAVAVCLAALTTAIIQYALWRVFGPDPHDGDSVPPRAVASVPHDAADDRTDRRGLAFSKPYVRPVHVFEDRRSIINMHRIEEGGRALFVHADEWTLVTFGEYSGVEGTQSWELSILQLPPTGGWTFVFGIRPDRNRKDYFDGEGLALVKVGEQAWELRVRRMMFSRTTILATHDIFAAPVTFEPSEPVRLQVTFERDALGAVFFNHALLPDLQQALESGELYQRGFGPVSGAVGILAKAANFRVTDIRSQGRDVLLKDASL